MKKTSVLVNAIAVPTLLFASNAFAHNDGIVTQQCDVTFKNKVSITPEHILVIEGNQTVYDIYNNETIFYKGEQVKLSPSDAALISRFSNETRSLIPTITEIAIEAVGIAFDGINAGLGQFGDSKKLDSKLANVKARLEEKFANQDGHYTFEEGSFNMDFADEELDNAIGEVVEQALPSLIGGVFQMLGSAIANGETDFTELENLEANIEQEIEARAELLEEKADVVCDKVEELAFLEKQIQAAHPNLRDFDLIDVNHNK
ncbi:YggN family protein [Psychrosphaera sp.]|nr:YggN family protein [Psychrosphaera sp.]